MLYKVILFSRTSHQKKLQRKVKNACDFEYDIKTKQICKNSQNNFDTYEVKLFLVNNQNKRVIPELILTKK